jgi:aspartyl-tRNA(Asn)/glutamyl-tRNA(Gln) amidotransferase subunit B
MYKAVIGLEVHCELDTMTKNFSSAPNKFTEIPNINVSAVDLGLPGILPYPNQEAVKKALKTAMALNCTNPDEVIFDRKNYFYPDLPKGYQITQVTKPMGRNGFLDIIVNNEKKRIYIHQLHLEEDTASLDHFSNYSLINYNRSGVPLIEIVTEPCLTNADEAVTFLEDLRDVFIFLGVSEARSNYGQMRCDVNISVMKDTDTKLGTKVEMKNINAFTDVRAAIEYEIKRQIDLIDSGKKVSQETRRIAEDGKTYPMREKVDAIDYKYFIEPNIPPVKLTKEYYEELKKEIPALKLERYEKYINEYHLSEYNAKVLSAKKDVSDYFEEVLSYDADIDLTVNFITSAILSTINKLEVGINDIFITPKMLSGLIAKIKSNAISLDHGKKILYQAIDQKLDPNELIKEQHLHQINDKDELLTLIKQVIDENPQQVKQYIEEDNTYIYNFFIGKVMQRTNRQANPNISLILIKEELERRKKNESK